MELVSSGAQHHWRAGARLSIASCQIPRGAIVPAELVSAFTPDKLDLMLRNRLLICVLGPPPAASAEKVVARFVDAPDPNADAKERERMVANSVAAGDPPWLYDPSLPKPAGGYTPRSPAIERSHHDQSLASNRTAGIITGT
jgi:hypothetical protein